MDLDFYPLTETCCQIDLYKLFDGGFNTGHGYLREPGGIRSAAALTAIALQSNQNEMHFESKCLCGVTHAANLTNLEMRVSIL